MQLNLSHRYVHFPIKAGADSIRIRFFLDDTLMSESVVELAAKGSDPDWWAFYDVSYFLGHEIRMEFVNHKTGDTIDSALLPTFPQSDTLLHADDLYREALRPLFHFSSRRGWLNDPNGLVYYAGEYHVYYQYNPFSTNWGNMHWGHAVSHDLIHWQEYPVAIYPKSFKDMAFSGGALVDSQNTAGFKIGDEQPIVVTYTSTGRGECVAYSTDRGRTFCDYAGNPVVKHNGRDPKVVWYEPLRRWIMVVYEEKDKRKYAFYGSQNLKDWQYLSAIEGFYECPEFFPLAIDGDPAQTKWVLHGAAWLEQDGKGYATRSSYLVGSFDGNTFTPETRILDGHQGPHFYAAQSFSNVNDGRRLMMGWMSSPKFPDMPFNQCMTVPLELSLRTTPEGPRLYFWPTHEIGNLVTETSTTSDLTLEDANHMLACDGELFDITIKLTPGQATVALVIRGLVITYHGNSQEIQCQDKLSKLPLVNGQIELRVLVDRSVLEIFGNQGYFALAYAGDIFPDKEGGMLLKADAGVGIDSLTISTLQSSWV